MKRFAVFVLETIGRILWGFKPNLMRDIVETKGAKKGLSFILFNMPSFDKTVKQVGGQRANFIASVISILNGCPYCTYGHALGFQFHYFNNHGKLFPIDEYEMMELNKQEKAEVIELLAMHLKTANLETEYGDLHRVNELMKDKDLAHSKDDEVILKFIKIFDFLNFCAISQDTTLDYAHDPINKNKALVEKYYSVRGQNKTSDS